VEYNPELVTLSRRNATAAGVADKASFAQGDMFEADISQASVMVLFLLPAMAVLAWTAWPFFLDAWTIGEGSTNAGGLIRWPVYAMIPLGFGLLWLQGVSELIKRIAFLKGLIGDPTLKAGEKSAEEELAEEIRKLAEAKAQQQA
jgi:hypothetical protein